MSFRSAVIPGTFCCLVSLCAMTTHGDVVRLKSGGEVRGVITASDKEARTTTVKTRSGTSVTVADSQIDFISRRSEKVEEYVTRSRTVEDSIEARMDLAEWCRSQGLLEQREEQLEQVLTLDPDQPDARKTLGYVRHLGRWMTQADMMAERGYFRHQGRWVTRQELELLEDHAAQKTAEASWIPKVRTWVSWLTGPSSERQQTALQELQSIQDVNAIGALTRFMSEHKVPDVRFLYVKILAQIDGPRPVPGLVDRLLLDPLEGIRQEALKVLLSARGELALPYLIAALKHKSNPVVCRAATALGEIGNQKAVPFLIDALVTTHSYQTAVAVPAPQNVSVQFSSTNAPGFSGLLPPNVEIAARTGQLPYGVNVVSNNTTPMVMRPVIVSEDVKNPDVLAALGKLTSQDFGFDERNWHLWWAVNNS